ncbi:hypothetical protein D3C76_1407440 [compost metagenome]
MITTACNAADARGNFAERVRQTGCSQPAIYVNVDHKQYKEQQSRLRQGAPEDGLVFWRPPVDGDVRSNIFFRQPDQAVSSLSVVGTKWGNGGVKQIFFYIVK